MSPSTTAASPPDALTGALTSAGPAWGDAPTSRAPGWVYTDPGGMQPTAHALAVAQTVSDALAALEQGFVRPQAFEPAVSERAFRLAMTDIGEIIFLPALVRRLHELAPRLSLGTVRNTSIDLPAEMAQGSVDLAVGWLPRLGAGFHQRRLFTQRYVALMAAGHPLAQGRLTAARFVRARHAVASPSISNDAFQVMPDLPVRRNNRIRAGGDYWIKVGTDGLTSRESLDYFRRMDIRYLTAKGGETVSAAENALHSRFGDFLQPDGPWSLDRLKAMQDDCRAADMILEGIRMDSSYIAMKPGPERSRYLDIICENIRKASQAGVALVSYHWTMIPIQRNRSMAGRGGSTYHGFKLEE